MKSICNALLAFALSLGAFGNSYAALLFDYTGNPFNFDTINASGFNPNPAERVTASLIMDLPNDYTGDVNYSYYADWFGQGEMTFGLNLAASWSFKAGIANLNSGDAGISNFSYRFSLDNGQITGWFLNAQTAAIAFQTLSADYQFFAPNEASDIVLTHDPQLNTASIYNAQGIWAVSAVPEPKTYALMLGGLGIMGIMGCRRKRKAA